MFISLDAASRAYGKKDVEALIKENKLKVITKTVTTRADKLKENTKANIFLTTSPSFKMDYVDEELLATLLDEAGKL